MSPAWSVLDSTRDLRRILLAHADGSAVLEGYEAEAGDICQVLESRGTVDALKAIEDFDATSAAAAVRS